MLSDPSKKKKKRIIKKQKLKMIEDILVCTIYQMVTHSIFLKKI